MTHPKAQDRRFAELISRHEKIIFSVCFFYASADNPYDDLRQEVLISLFKGLRTFRGESSESTWVYRVCINTCLFSLRKSKRRITTVPLEDLPGINCQSECDDEFSYKLQCLHSAISRLNPIEKALILMWLDGLTYEDIAVNMGMPRNTVASRLHRIKEKLSSINDN